MDTPESYKNPGWIRCQNGDRVGKIQFYFAYASSSFCSAVIVVLSNIFCASKQLNSNFAFSALTLLAGQQEGHLACEKDLVLVCWWWWFDWSFAWPIASAVTTISTILCFKKTPANPDSPGEWPLKQREATEQQHSFMRTVKCTDKSPGLASDKKLGDHPPKWNQLSVVQSKTENPQGASW